MKFVHAADLHIDSPLLGLSRYEGAPVDRIRSATRRAFTNLVSLCLEHRVELLLLAGDLFDGDWKDYSTGLFFIAELSRLAESGTQVVYVRGNHDAASHITKHLRLPPFVRELSTKRAETLGMPELGVAVHGRSYDKRAETQNLALDYPDAVPSTFNIGLLHTCLSGRVGHENYAPCSLDELLAKGYDYWALGHVHEREVLCETPWVVFSGNLQGRHSKETGPKGATLVEVTDGVIRSVTAHELCVVRFEDRQFSADGIDDPDDIVDAVASRVAETHREVEGKTLVLRMTVEGRTAAHNAFQVDPARWEAEIRARAAEHSDVWLSQIAFRTLPHLDIDRVRERRDAVGQVLRAVNEAANDPERLRELSHLFDDLAAKLPPEVRDGSEGLRLDDPEALKETLREVEQLLLVHLVTDAD